METSKDQCEVEDRCPWKDSCQMKSVPGMFEVCRSRKAILEQSKEDEKKGSDRP